MSISTLDYLIANEEITRLIKQRDEVEKEIRELKDFIKELENKINERTK